MPSPVVADEWMSRLPGLDRLWSLTRGSAEVRIAVLDGPADGASLSQAAVAASGVVEHGTHVQSIIGGSSLGRPATPEEVADAVTWLASPRAAMTTGSSLLVDGGWTAR